MSKSKRESNYRKQERRYSDGTPNMFEYRQHKQEKKLKNIIRSNDVNALMYSELEQVD